MAYKIINQFVKELGTHQVTTITGPMSPLLLMVPWSTDKKIPLDVLTINKGRKSLLVVDEYNYHLFAEQKLRDYFEKKVTLEQLKKAYYKYADSSKEIYDELVSTNISVLSESELINLLKKATTVFEPVADTVYIETLSYEMALRAIGQNNQKVLDAVWSQSIQPTFISFEGRRLEAILKLIKSTEDISSIVRKVKYIYTDYFWTKSDSEILTSLKEIQTNIKQKEEELNKIIENTESRKATFDSWTSTLGKDEKFLADYIQMVMLFRDTRKDPIAQVQAVFIELVGELLSRAGIDANYGRVVCTYECFKGIEYLKGIRDEIIKRSDGNISIIKIDRTYDFEICNYDNAVEELLLLTTRKHDGNGDTIKGQVANKGKVTGTVRVVIDPHDDKGFVQGDILVTSMTRPEFVPIMKKAGAVITDEGGITCHAAIISRELNIPCVIGTKKATRVLKDGDRVEVDANIGVITKVK